MAKKSDFCGFAWVLAEVREALISRAFPIERSTMSFSPPLPLQYHFLLCRGPAPTEMCPALTLRCAFIFDTMDWKRQKFFTSKYFIVIFLSAAVPLP